MNATSRFNLWSLIKMGLLAGAVALLISLVGMVEASNNRFIIIDVLTLGQTLLLIVLVFAAYMAVREVRADYAGEPPRPLLILGGAIAGLITNTMLVALVLIGSWINLRPVFANASSALYDILTLGLGIPTGLIVLMLVGAVVGTLTAVIMSLPKRLQKAMTLGLGLIPTVAILDSALFAGRGLSDLGAIAIFLVSAGGYYMWNIWQPKVEARVNSLSPAGQQTLQQGKWVLGVLIILLLPLLGAYPSEVLDLVGLFVLMALGLNIVVGFAGLLDLGYVAFFAIGAYTMAVLTSPEITWLPINVTFWVALPLAALMATLWGIILGVPVLGMRGDYLAIVTLGFGEIIRLVALSDWLKPFIGGSNGITLIPKPVIGPIELATPQTLYYLILAGCLLAAFVAIRVKDSRLGRSWMAMREDEDVAQAMGIDLVRTKLLAFATGATFAGLAGAIFATKLTSIYPHSFNLLISINVLCVIIVGGIGSIPGVIVGALFLVGLPELLREFAEYRLMMYGAVLVIMMLTRPEGIWPEARRRLELHEEELSVVDAAEDLEVHEAEPSPAGASTE
jgi:branched-chain amino acid transport system permease protein